jgi:2-polyprenyl-3-methyl-5-hydroxy-6-metoxy-1,4-benzoquinol methylase
VSEALDRLCGELGISLKYDCDLSALPPHTAARFVRLEPDGETERYLESAGTRRHGWLKTRLHHLLTDFLSDFDANGTLNMYAMHLLSPEQWAKLLPPAQGLRLLDLGAGSGDVTESFTRLGCEVRTTERSRAMAKRLNQRGLACTPGDVAVLGVPEPPYDIITCLNVIDRCPKPLGLLRAAVAGLRPQGILVIATPLPYSPFYYDGARTQSPLEKLACPGDTWEVAVSALIDTLRRTLNLHTLMFARCPYFCGGDHAKALYTLDDAVLICRSESLNRA